MKKTASYNFFEKKFQKDSFSMLICLYISIV